MIHDGTQAAAPSCSGGLTVHYAWWDPRYGRCSGVLPRVLTWVIMIALVGLHRHEVRQAQQGSAAGAWHAVELWGHLRQGRWGAPLTSAECISVIYNAHHQACALPVVRRCGVL